MYICPVIRQLTSPQPHLSTIYKRLIKNLLRDVFKSYRHVFVILLTHISGNARRPFFLPLYGRTYAQITPYKLFFMMTFSTLPTSYAPIGQPLWCSLSGVADPQVEVRILLSDDTLLGVKRFVGDASPTFDLAPYLRRVARFSPSGDRSTGVASAADRQLMIRLEAVSASAMISSPLMIFRPADVEEQPTALLTTLPTERLLAPDEWDELTFLADAPQPLRVVVTGRDGSTRVLSHVIPADTLALFHLAAADFPDADQLLVDAGACGAIHYTILPAAEGACRLAWASRRGSIEHYTFSVVQRVEFAVEKVRGYGEEGYCVGYCEAEERLVLQSALETDAMLNGLKELLQAEQVWLVQASGYERVDVLTEKAEIHRHGLLSSLTLTIRSTQKNKQLWN